MPAAALVTALVCEHGQPSRLHVRRESQQTGLRGACMVKGGEISDLGGGQLENLRQWLGAQ